METLKYIAKKYGLDLNQRQQPIEIPNANRISLAELFRELDFRVGVEMGVEEGIYSEILCQKNRELHLFSIDAWTAYRGYREHVSQYKLDFIYEKAKIRLKPYRCKLIKNWSTEAVKEFKDGSLDFVYIDGNHEYQQVVNDICVWTKKVRVGGIVAGHDYIKRVNPAYLMHVMPALHGYLESYQIKPFFVLGRKHAGKNEMRDKTRSWFFVKPDMSKFKI